MLKALKAHAHQVYVTLTLYPSPRERDLIREGFTVQNYIISVNRANDDSQMPANLLKCPSNTYKWGYAIARIFSIFAPPKRE